MPVIDNTARAERLCAFADDRAKLNEECYGGADVDLDAPRVPHRFACAQFDGRGSWIAFADTLDEAREIQRNAPCEEYPWSPGDVIDLDTGECYETRIEATLAKYSHGVTGVTVIAGCRYHHTKTVTGAAAAAAVADRWRELDYVDVEIAELLAPAALENRKP